MRVMSANHDHRERAGELLAAIAADPQRNLEHAAMAAIAEAMLAVADELDDLRELLTMRLPAGLTGPLETGIKPGLKRGSPRSGKSHKGAGGLT